MRRIVLGAKKDACPFSFAVSGAIVTPELSEPASVDPAGRTPKYNQTLPESDACPFFNFCVGYLYLF
jgi:hypothetical protein